MSNQEVNTNTPSMMSDEDYNSTITYVNECLSRFRQAFFDADPAAMIAAMLLLNGGTAAVLKSMGSPFTTSALETE